MKLEFIQITQVREHYLKSFNRVQSTQDEKARFIKGNEFKWTQVELFSILFFKRVVKTSLNIKALIFLQFFMKAAVSSFKWRIKVSDYEN